MDFILKSDIGLGLDTSLGILQHIHTNRFASPLKNSESCMTVASSRPVMCPKTPIWLQDADNLLFLVIGSSFFPSKMQRKTDERLFPSLRMATNALESSSVKINNLLSSTPGSVKIHCPALVFRSTSHDNAESLTL